MFFRSARSLARLGAANKNVAVSQQRTLYPFYSRILFVRSPGSQRIPTAEKIAVYIAFVVGIFGPPSYIMYDVGRKRPDRKV